MRGMATGIFVVCGLLFGLGLVSCGGGSTVTPAPDFSLAATPTTLTLTPGAAGQTVSLTATAVNGFSSAVTVTISGLPTGVTATPTTLTLTPGAAKTVTLTAGGTAAAGASTVTFTGTSGTVESYRRRCPHRFCSAVTRLFPRSFADFAFARQLEEPAPQSASPQTQSVRFPAPLRSRSPDCRPA